MLKIATRYRRILGRPGSGGDFDPDTAVTHAIEEGRTLCGKEVGLNIRNGGRWEVAFGGMRDVNCRACLKRAQP